MKKFKTEQERTKAIHAYMSNSYNHYNDTLAHKAVWNCGNIWHYSQNAVKRFTKQEHKANQQQNKPKVRNLDILRKGAMDLRYIAEPIAYDHFHEPEMNIPRKEMENGSAFKYARKISKPYHLYGMQPVSDKTILKLRKMMTGSGQAPSMAYHLDPSNQRFMTHHHIEVQKAKPLTSHHLVSHPKPHRHFNGPTL